VGLTEQQAGVADGVEPPVYQEDPAEERR
jgi:hypothetical protein